MADELSKTFAELEAMAAVRWADIGAQRADRARRIADEIAASPDVINAPAIGSLWSHPALVCPCGSIAFKVLRYACVNGVKDRTELSCTRCDRTDTWNWPDMRWTTP